MFNEITARNINIKALDILKSKFKDVITSDYISDANFMDSYYKVVVGFANLKYKCPIVMELCKDIEILCIIKKICNKGNSLLFKYNNDEIELFSEEDDVIKKVKLSKELSTKVLKLYKSVENWAGELNGNGEHIIDLKSPTVSPHYSVNLLMGNRIGYSNILQTTPKSVVDMFGRGSFRSHADTQVLATRWDMRQEENGFPANRQFYIYENCKMIFYSADVKDENVVKAKCKHSQNKTVINYKLNCGLEIQRILFILPQYNGLPIATEVQSIEIINKSKEKRNLRIVYTGMFGSAVQHSLYEDVMYSNLVLQSKILQDNDGNLIAVTPDYYPVKCREDVRFHTTIMKVGNNYHYPTEFCMNYNEFVGSGTLSNPDNGALLSNNLSSKGPGFFANAIEVGIEKESQNTIDNFTGLISIKDDSVFDVNQIIKNLIDEYDKDLVEKSLLDNEIFYRKYKDFLSIKSSDELFDSYVNSNLPYQVLYQTFMSRSFGQTQKGYREIGFREIQDLFSSMYYFVASENVDVVKKLLLIWCENVYAMGYVNHNFYWVGKEPGKWSDDGLWLIQAISKFIDLTGDYEFLKTECGVADLGINKKRNVYNTLKAIIEYSSDISIGENGFPLIDFADWNDCLKIDPEYLDGPTKEKKYFEWLTSENKCYGSRFESKKPESIMNAFLLKIAIDQLINIAAKKDDRLYKNLLTKKSKDLLDNLNNYAWKKDFFARALFNDSSKNVSFLGCVEDGFSASNHNGTYFLNSFSWSVLSGVATEDKIDIMLKKIEKYLKTDFGFKLVSELDLSKVSGDAATSHYFEGDRENGGVFKHATMMCVTAMFRAAKFVKNISLAEKLSELAYWMIDLTLPYKTIEKPFETFGNPRFCTQYNNSKTGENVGPILSGTATWLNLAIIESLGIDIKNNTVYINPIIRNDENEMMVKLSINGVIIEIQINKEPGFKRLLDCKNEILINGEISDKAFLEIDKNILTNKIEINF